MWMAIALIVVMTNGQPKAQVEASPTVFASKEECVQVNKEAEQWAKENNNPQMKALVKYDCLEISSQNGFKEFKGGKPA